MGCKEALDTLCVCFCPWTLNDSTKIASEGYVLRSCSLVCQGELTNVGEVETSVEELQVSDLALMAFAVLPVEQFKKKACDSRPTELWGSASWTRQCQVGDC